jgi:hypothetical protein
VRSTRDSVLALPCAAGVETKIQGKGYFAAGIVVLLLADIERVNRLCQRSYELAEEAQNLLYLGGESLGVGQDCC